MGSKYSHVFAPIRIRGIDFKNRITLAPTTPVLATEDGIITHEFVDWFRMFARGGTSVLYLGNCSIDLKENQDQNYQLDLGTDRGMLPMTWYADMARQYGCHASFEINHAGEGVAFETFGRPGFSSSSFISEDEIIRARMAGREPIPCQEMSKEKIKEYICRELGYDLSRTCDEIRPGYHHIETCQETVPEAITAFLEGNSFEDVIRTAVSLGGDCDTLTCIAGGIAEAFYGVPEKIEAEGKKHLPEDMLEVVERFHTHKKESVPKDEFLDGNELIEEAIKTYYMEQSRENLARVIEAIRQRMHADGHFIFPVIQNENGESAFRLLNSGDGKEWYPAFTSQGEFEKGAKSAVISHFIDSMLKNIQKSDASGIVINPWGQSFALTKELIEVIFKADGGLEYSVPDDPITPELLEDGSFLKKAIEICNLNRTKLNLIKLARILRNSFVWIPCNAVMSDADYEALAKMVDDAKDDPESLKGQTITSKEAVRLVPDILQNDDDYFFPVFSTVEEMGEYGDHFSKVQKHFLEAANLARNNEKKVKGIVINAFSEPFVVPVEMIDVIAEMEASIRY